MMNESAKLKIWIEDHISLLAPICGLIALSVVVFTYSDFSILKFEIIYVAIGVAIAIIFHIIQLKVGKILNTLLVFWQLSSQFSFFYHFNHIRVLLELSDTLSSALC